MDHGLSESGPPEPPSDVVKKLTDPEVPAVFCSMIARKLLVGGAVDAENVKSCSCVNVSPSGPGGTPRTLTFTLLTGTVVGVSVTACAD